MPVNVNEIMRKLSPAERKKVKDRAAEIIAEEMSLRQRFAPRKAQRPVAFDPAKNSQGNGRQCAHCC